MEQNTSKTTLFILLVILILLIIGAGIYCWIVFQPFGITTTTTVSTTTTSSSQTTVSADVDSEISTLDKAMSSISDDDFGEDQLSDSQLGL